MSEDSGRENGKRKREEDLGANGDDCAQNKNAKTEPIGGDGEGAAVDASLVGPPPPGEEASHEPQGVKSDEGHGNGVKKEEGDGTKREEDSENAIPPAAQKAGAGTSPCAADASGEATTGIVPVVLDREGAAVDASASGSATETTEQNSAGEAKQEEAAVKTLEGDAAASDPPGNDGDGASSSVAQPENSLAAAGNPSPNAPGGFPAGLPPMESTLTGSSPPVAAPATANPSSAAAPPENHPEQVIEERGEVSALYVGRVIGKGGEMIRDLQARSGARIDVDQDVPAGQPRVITYRGTRKTVDFAKRLVDLLSRDGANEASLPLGEAKREFLVIPAVAVGKVIGRGGEMIRELQSRSQAKIQVDHTGVSGIPPDQKQVTITGTEHGVVKAKEMVLFLVGNPMMDAMQALNMLVDDKLRGGQWGSGPPYHNLPNQGVNMQPYMVAPGGFPGGPGAGGGFHPSPPGYGAPPMPGAPYEPATQQPQQGYNPFAAGAAGGTNATEVDITYAKKQYMGRVIGQKGATINDLQRRSGCDIQINQEVAAGQDCEITIRGTRQGIETVKQMIREIIEIGPNHPYAGGAEQAYSGGGGGVGGPTGAAGIPGGVLGGYPQGYDYPQQPYGYQPVGGYGGYDPQHGGYPQQPPTMYGHHQGPPHQQQTQQQPPQPYGGGYGLQQQQQQPYGYAQQPTMPPAAPPPSSSSGWKSTTAPDGQVYYYNERTGETQWEKPAGMP